MSDVDEWGPELVSAIRKYALQNAVEYNGSGKSGSVLGRLLSEFPELRADAKQLIPLISEQVDESNMLANEFGLEHVREILKLTNPEALNREKQKKRIGLPDLEISKGNNVILRFAPNPNGPLSIGHSRGVVINSEYAKKYSGKVILRFDDTDTKVKPPLESAYSMIEEEFEWISGVKPDLVIRASSRMEIYLEAAEEMISRGICYVCRCTASEFKALRDSKEACICRGRRVEQNILDWKMMIGGEIDEGGAVVRVKTDLELPNPALRDWPALRIQHTAHPIVGNRYKVWPLLDFQSAVEDHLQGVTHIVRGKDLMDSTRKQTLLYELLEWDYPQTLYWGRVKLLDFGGFSTSSIRKSVENGDYSGWDDPRLPTVAALRRRGFSSESLREFWIELGLSQKDISIPMQSIESKNSKIIDKSSERRSFIQGPRELHITSENGDEIDNYGSISIRRHPDYPEMGERKWDLGDGSIFISKNDYTEGLIRLKDFADVEIKGDTAKILSREKNDSLPIIHWVSSKNCIEADMIISRGNEIDNVVGMIENIDVKAGQTLQLERMGFAKVERISDSGKVSLIWLHG
ncbi:MAG TPA: glutamate--tRNA ligase [Candidatus Thalassarchaeaceae archaeon]|nr:MAG TPA: glutamate--tRNA ligase [Candidatus Poseidoniales archaeon]HII35338.1 glutamate--tRNA ligase [Candidatus Thalassarchaeaceae archaeon]